MTQSIRRGDQWWHRRQDGAWLLWSKASQTWEAQAGSPPPPPPPPPVPATPAAPVVEPISATPAAGLEAASSSAAADPAPSEIEGGGTAVAVKAPPEAAPVVEAPSEGPEVATPPAQGLQLPPQSEGPQVAPPPEAETAATAPLEVVETISATMPLTGPRAANSEIYSAGSASFFGRFESRTLSVVGGALAVVIVFALTYMGATFAFRPSDDAEPTTELPAKVAFVAQADVMCSDASRSAMGLPPPGSPASMAAFAEQSIASQRKLVGKLRTLAVPPARKALFKEMLSKNRVQIRQMQGLVVAASAGDQAGIGSAMHRLAASEKRIDTMNRKLGFKECS